MKKSYQKPTIDVVAIEVQQMIAQSIATGESYSGGQIGANEYQDSGSSNEDW